MHTSEWRVEPGNMATWTKVMRGSEQDGDLEIVAKTYAIEGYTAEDVANLIAAAPQLLEACKRMMFLIQDFDRSMGRNPGIIFDAMGAIRQAQGDK